jgi:hypothetical protein
MRYLEDFAFDQKFSSARFIVDVECIKSFAVEFEPWPLHLDDAVGRDMLLSELTPLVPVPLSDVRPTGYRAPCPTTELARR